MMKPNSWPEKQHDHLQRELRGQRNLERLQSDVIKYINMFSHLPARTKLYELFVPQRRCRNVNDCKVKWIMPSGSCWLVLTSSKEGSYWLLTFKCYSSTIFWGWADHVDRQGLKDKHLHSKTHIGASAIDSTERRHHSSMCARVSLSTALADAWAQLTNTAASSRITNCGLSWEQCHTPTKRRSRMPYLARLISGVGYKNVSTYTKSKYILNEKACSGSVPCKEWSFTQNVWTLKRFSHILEEVIMKMTDNDTQKSSIMSPK